MRENKAEKKSYIIIRSSLGCHESVIVVAKWAIKKGFTSTLGRGRTFLLLHTLLVSTARSPAQILLTAAALYCSTSNTL